MMYLIHHRDVVKPEYCQGQLQAGALYFQTIELPWVPDPVGRGGVHEKSCVPFGLYKLVLHNTPAHPKCLALVNPDLDVYHEPADVPLSKRAYARTAILLHVANYPISLRGCIGIGLTRGQGCINESVQAMDQFRAVVPWKDGHSLLITPGAEQL